MSTATGGIPEMGLGGWMRRARDLAHRSQAEAALAVGVSRALVGRWEQDAINSWPDVTEFRRLVVFYEAPWLWEVLADQPRSGMAYLKESSEEALLAG